MKNTVIALSLILFSSSAYAGLGNAANGKAKAATCIACHGAKGISPNPAWPNLAGQKDQYMYMQLKAFKTGQRKSPLMSPNAATLSDQDMKDLATYYSEMK